jgi:PAS domain S-box-containing protein
MGAFGRAIGEFTRRTRAEQELRRERELLRSVLDTIPVMITLYDPDTRLLRLNREFERLVGWSSGEAHGLSLMERCYPDPAYPEAMRAYMESLAPGWRDIVMTTRDGGSLQTSWANIRLSDDTFVGIGVDITERKRAEERQGLLLAELSHRVKNTLAVVLGIASRTLAGDRSLPEARDTLAKRLGALAKTHELLTAAGWRGVSLRALAEAELRPYGPRAAIAGEDLTLGPKAAQTFALVLHELATNAAKHGALSAPEGRIEIGWEAADGRFRLRWRERDGPSVRPPERQGFGRTLLERGVAYELGGEVTLDFRPAGLVCEARLSLAQVLASA